MKKQDETLSRALLTKSPEEAMKILRDAGVFISIQCHGYSMNSVDDSLIVKNMYNTKKWWQFWK